MFNSSFRYLGESVLIRCLNRPLKYGIIAAMVMTGVSLFLPNYYKSEARILPVSPSGGTNLGQLASAAAAFGLNIPGQDGADANYIDVVKSRWVCEQLLDRTFQFKARPWLLGSQATYNQTLYDYLGVKNRDRAIREVGSVLSATRDLKTKLLVISAETRSAELSQQIVVQSVKLLESFVQTKGRTRGSAKAAFAEARLHEAREEMTQVEDQFRKFLEGNRNYQSSADPSVRIQGARIEAELNLRRQLVSTLTVNREQALLEERNDMPILNILDPGNLPTDKSKPARSSLVILVFFLVGISTLCFEHRAWLRSRFFEEAQQPIDEA